MNQEGCSIKSQKVKNSDYVSAGSLASSRNKQVLKQKHKLNSGCIPHVQVIRSNERHHRHKKKSNYIPAGSHLLEQVQQQSLNSVFPAAQTVHEQVQQVLPDSTTPAVQAAHKQVQQESHLPTTPALQAFQEQMQQHRQDSTNLETNDQSKEQGPSTNKRKRGGTQMQMVHGRSERKLIMLNELNQPIGPTKAVVTEFGSFLGTLARNGTFWPLHVSNRKKLKTIMICGTISRFEVLNVPIFSALMFHIFCANPIASNFRRNMTFLILGKIGLWNQLKLLGEGISVG